MTTLGQVRIAPVGVAGDLGLADLVAALAAGWRDFRAFPAYGLFFGAVYALAGIFLYEALLDRGAVGWLVPLAAGFPFVAPFTAVGLYEVSRRREAGLPVHWRAVLGRGDEQILSIGVIAFVAFGIWIMLAHGIFAIFMGKTGLAAVAPDVLFSSAGIAMLLVGSIVGGLMALALYAITVISLPMLVDREVDFITAIIVSLAAVRSNGVAMLAWAALIAVVLFAALLPLFAGLLVALPVLGHATWHLYRRLVRDPAG